MIQVRETSSLTIIRNEIRQCLLQTSELDTIIQEIVPRHPRRRSPKQDPIFYIHISNQGEELWKNYVETFAWTKQEWYRIAQIFFTNHPRYWNQRLLWYALKTIQQNSPIELLDAIDQGDRQQIIIVRLKLETESQ